MQTHGSRTWKTVLLMGSLVVFTACNQQEFYEKQFLEGAGVADDRGPVPEITFPGDENTPPDTVVITTPDDDGDDQNTEDEGDGPGGGDDNDDEVVVLTPPTPDPEGDGDGNDDEDEVPVVVIVPTPTPTPGPQEPTEPEVILSERVEKFIQNKAKDAPVDILWVIDDSGSMGDEQRALAYNFEVFINEFIEKKIDFQMAITTTDGSSYRGDGRYKGSLTALTSVAAAQNESRFIKDFKKMVQVGTSGSGTEMGLYTAERFLERYNTSSSQWLRKDAYLIIVQLSDEEEQSRFKVEDMVAKYTSYKDNAGMVKVYTIVTTDLRGAQWETIGHRYMKAATLTGGVIADIHLDFYTVLRDMGAKIVDLLDKFALAQAPYQGVSVSVNGTTVTEGFLYNPETRTIKFLNGHIPAEGSEIVVKYQVIDTSTLLASGSN